MVQLSELQQQATQYFGQQKYSEAIALYEQSIELDSTVLSNYWYLGLALLLQGQESEAQVTWLTAMAQVEPEHIESQTLELIEILEAEAQRQTAKSEFLFAWIIRHYIREVFPNSINNLLKMILLPIRGIGDYLSEKQRIILQVIDLLNSADSLKIDNYLILEVLGEINPLESNSIRFFEQCFRLNQLNKDNPRWLEIEYIFANAYYKNAQLLMRQARLQEAVNYLRKAIEMMPIFSELHFYLGVVLSNMRQYDEAISSLEKAIDVNPEHPQAHQKLSQVKSYSNQIKLKKYHFTGDVFTDNIPIWKKYLCHFVNAPEIQALEIGSYEGDSACWLLDNILTHQSARLTCIDPFPDWYDDIFDFNISRTGSSDKVQKIKGLSQEALRWLPLNSYNLLYIDGSHLASDVLEDAVLSWRLVKPGGIIIFDDYDLVYLRSSVCDLKVCSMFGSYSNPSLNPKVGIDAFLSTFEEGIKILHKDHQVIVEKIS